MIELLTKLDKSVLITAHTNTAVDNILLKLLERKVDFARFGFSTITHPGLHSMLEKNLITYCDSPESLHTFYCSKLSILFFRKNIILINITFYFFVKIFNSLIKIYGVLCY